MPESEVTQSGAGPAQPRQIERGDAAPRDVAERLDRAMLRMRRLVAKPPAASLPIPSLGHCVDFAKVMACLAVAEGMAEGHDTGSGRPAGPAKDARPVTAMSVKDIAAALHLEHSTASRLLSETEADGLVGRCSDPGDRRRTVVTLTSRGRAVVADSTAMRTEAIARVFRAWDPADLQLLADLLERMVATLADRMPAVVADLSASPDGPAPC